VRTAVFVGIGWLGTALFTAIGSRLSIGHVLPDAAVVILVFVALRREPLPVTMTALALGYFVGRQAMAPIGLHEAVLVGCGLTIYLTAGSLAGSGAGFFALASGGTVMLYHAALYVVTRAGAGVVGFSGWATAALVPSGAATAALALIAHSLLSAIDRRLNADRREELSWH
jgi:hypothetical protein